MASVSSKTARALPRWLFVLGLLAGTQAWPAPSLTRSVTRADVLRATEAAIASGEFAKHMDYLDGLILTNYASPQGATSLAAWDRLLADEVVALAVAQSAVLHKVSPGAMANIANADTNMPAFLTWLFGEREALEALLDTIKPENSPGKVFPLWGALWSREPADGVKYRNLGLACAVVFDKPLRVLKDLDPRGFVDVNERYDYYRKADRQHQLKTDLTKLPAEELIWVVDAPVPTSELNWALKNIHLPRDQWAQSYTMIEYRMDKATQGAQIYNHYTLAEIRKQGGVCVDQAYFASVTAKAHGIPAIKLAGEGQRGGHAWFAYKTSSKWNMSVARFKTDQYATGYTMDPQTRQKIKEQMLNFLTDGQRHTPEYDKVSRLTWLADIQRARGLVAQAGSLLEHAVALSPRHAAAWAAYLNYLQQSQAPKERWKTVMQTARTNFRNYPDMLARLDASEAEAAPDVTNVDDVLKSLRTHLRKLEAHSKARSDLIMETIEQHLKLLSAAENTNTVMTIYEKSLKEFGDEAPVFKTLSKRYFTYALAHQGQKKALDVIGALFRKYYSTPTQDYFEISMRAAMMNQIAGFYEADGQTEKAAAQRKKAADMEKHAAAAHKNQR